MTNASRATLRADAEAIFRAAIRAVDPVALVAEHIARDGSDVVIGMAGNTAGRWRLPTLVIGAGKAAARMAAACEQVLGSENVHGAVVVADGCGAPLRSIAVSEAGHPLPDGRGERAALGIMDLVQQPRAGGIVCLISGGASSLLVRPRSPIQLSEKVRTTQLLLESGADIAGFNTVRKHISAVKGGGLLRAARVPVVTLLISDVVGDDPGTIGSGPTAPDVTTFSDACAVLKRFDLGDRVPAAVEQLLKMGVDGRVPETVKPGSPEAERCRNLIVGSNRTALEGAAREARARGWAVCIEDAALTGGTTTAAHGFGARLIELARHRGDKQPLCILAGGETTVRVTGSGRGGRNQEFALALAGKLVGQEVMVLSAGTDGIDGPTDAAGAFVDSTTAARAPAHGLDPDAALANNDAYTFFSQLGDLLRCGPTGTNVMDIKIALVPRFPGRTLHPVVQTRP